MSILGSRALTLRSYAAGSTGSDGRWTEGTMTTSTIRGSLQPLNGDELQSLDAGERQRRSRKVYLTSALCAGSVQDGRRADQVVDGSEVWDVRSVTRETAVLPHYKAILLAPQEDVG